MENEKRQCNCHWRNSNTSNTWLYIPSIKIQSHTVIRMAVSRSQERTNEIKLAKPGRNTDLCFCPSPESRFRARTRDTRWRNSERSTCKPSTYLSCFLETGYVVDRKFKNETRIKIRTPISCLL